MTWILAGLVIIASCLVGPLIIWVRHYLQRKSMHRNVATLMDFTPDCECGDRNGGNTSQDNEQNAHGAPR